MEPFYWFIFGFLAVVVAGLVLTQTKEGGIVSGNGVQLQAFFSLRNNYVFVYALMMAGDWLQGPYVYALYQHYGYDVKDIGRLFIAGFGSSMVFGTIVGSLADKHGRKKAALLYVLMYAASCATKHSPAYGILMLGRLLGGIATSLLFSAFESWLVAEHFSRGFEEKWLGDAFSKAVFVGNGLMAILAGLVASYLVDTMKLGPVAPFDAAIVVLLVGGAVIYASWPENYGDSAHGGEGVVRSLQRQFAAATGSILGDQRVALLGAMQSLFEASMYTFVFLWTPALSPAGEKIYHGMIFACFMTASMAGSSLSGILMKRYKVESYMQYVFGLSAVALSVPFLFNVRVAVAKDATLVAGTEEVHGMTLHGQIQLLAFCVFEVMVGVFWPSMMTLRARFIPEETRSTIINMFRIPLNLFVCIILYNVHLFPLSAMFALCSTFLAIAALLQVRLERLIRGKLSTSAPVKREEAQCSGKLSDEDSAKGATAMRTGVEADEISDDEGRKDTVSGSTPIHVASVVSPTRHVAPSTSPSATRRRAPHGPHAEGDPSAGSSWETPPRHSRGMGRGQGQERLQQASQEHHAMSGTSLDAHTGQVGVRRSPRLQARQEHR